jgi:hypothetical protein
MLSSAAELLVQEWIKLYKKAPKVTIIASILTFVLSGISGYIQVQNKNEILEAKRLQSQSYATQVNTLDETHRNLLSLIEFVDSERKNLKSTELALQSIKTEREKLQPLIESDRKTIDAIFAAQEGRNQSAQSTERWIGFGLGVLSSLIASLVWAAVAYTTKKSKLSDLK